MLKCSIASILNYHILEHISHLYGFRIGPTFKGHSRKLECLIEKPKIYDFFPEISIILGTQSYATDLVGLKYF